MFASFTASYAAIQKQQSVQLFLGVASGKLHLPSIIIQGAIAKYRCLFNYFATTSCAVLVISIIISYNNALIPAVPHALLFDPHQQKNQNTGLIKKIKGATHEQHIHNIRCRGQYSSNDRDKQ